MHTPHIPPSMPFGPRPSSRAFTIIEMIGAMVVGLILASIGVAGYRIYQSGLPAKHAAKRLASSFSAARSYAIANNATYAVRYDTEQHNFWIDQTDTNGTVVVPKVMHPEKIEDKVTVEGIYFGTSLSELTQDVIPILFYPDGSSDDVRIYITPAGAPEDSDEVYTVRLYGPTGLSRVFEKERR